MGIFSKLFGGSPEDEQPGGESGKSPAEPSAKADAAEKLKGRPADAKPAKPSSERSQAPSRPPAPAVKAGSPPPAPPRDQARSRSSSDDLRARSTQIGGPSFTPPGSRSKGSPKLSVAGPPPPPQPDTKAGSSAKPGRARHSKPIAAVPSKTPPPRGRAQELKAKRERQTRESARPSLLNGVNGAPRSPLHTGKVEGSIFDDISGETNAAFDAIESETRAPSGPAALAYDASTRDEVNKLFGEVAATHARQIRNFMLELSLGETTKQWAELCRPAIAALEKAADGMDLDKVVKGLREYREALNHACAMPGSRIGGEARDLLQSRYKKLTQELPETFKLDEDRDRREPIIVHTLLAQVPSVHKVTVDKLYSAGVVSLEALMEVTPSDLAMVAGISSDLADAIVQRVQQYRETRAEQVGDPADDASREHLRGVVKRLREAHQRFCSADEDDNRELKREVRRARTDLLHEINLLLAQIGEIDMVHELERAPFESKIERLSSYLRTIPRAAHG